MGATPNECDRFTRKNIRQQAYRVGRPEIAVLLFWREARIPSQSAREAL